MRPKIIAVYSQPLIRTHFRISPYMHQHYAPTSDTNAQRDAMNQQERQTKSTRKVSSTCITKIGGLCGKFPRLNGQKHVLIGHSLYTPPTSSNKRLSASDTEGVTIRHKGIKTSYKKMTSNNKNPATSLPAPFTMN